MRLANAYFLGIAILNCIPTISAISPASSISPLVFVLLVSITREGIEDYFRYQSDKATNGQPVKILRDVEDPATKARTLKLVDDVASAIAVGDIVLTQDE